MNCYSICTNSLSQNECGAQEKTFTVHSPGEISSTYTIQMGDELIVAALSLFYPDLLKITGSKSTVTQKPNPGDPDDPFDENYLRETSVSTAYVEIRLKLL